jgi:hypothetical protein
VDFCTIDGRYDLELEREDNIVRIIRRDHGGREIAFDRPPPGTDAKRAWILESSILAYAMELAGNMDPDESYVSKLERAHEALHLIKYPKPETDEDKARVARIEAEVAKILEDPETLERFRIEAHSDAAAKEGNTVEWERIEKFWDVDQMKYVVPEDGGNIPAGWPGDVLPEQYVLGEVTERNKPQPAEAEGEADPETDPDPDPETDPEPEQPPERTGMHALLDEVEGGRAA